GIFEAVVYRADLQVSGTFLRPSFAQWRVDPQDVLWDEAYLSVGVPDLRGLRSRIGLAWGERPRRSRAGVRGLRAASAGAGLESRTGGRYLRLLFRPGAQRQPAASFPAFRQTDDGLSPLPLAVSELQRRFPAGVPPRDGHALRRSLERLLVRAQLSPAVVPPGGGAPGAEGPTW